MFSQVNAVEQLCRYLELLNRDPLLRPVGGVLAAQSITPRRGRLQRTEIFGAWCSTMTPCAASSVLTRCSR